MLKQRVITALISLVLLLVVLFALPPLSAKGMIALVVLAGAWEWSAFLESGSRAIRVVYVALIGVLMAAVNLVWHDGLQVVLLVALAWWLAALVWAFRFPTPIPAALRWICGALVLVPLYAALIALYEMSPWLLLFALLIVWSADVGAFFAGRQFGKVKLAPKISPGKTWEGVIGGLSLVAVLAAIITFQVDAAPAVLVPFCVAVAFTSIIGDLTVSMFKRTSGLKDSGTLFPGHGGVLDRIDSVSAAAPLFALGLPWLGLV
jgi:phosphatidate cytidylyltransferase